MSLYEHIFICRQDISQQQVEDLTAQFSSVISDNGGSIAKTEYWGLRSMAYKVKKNRKGHYALLNIDASHEAITEMERQMSLNDDIIRFLTIRVDEHDTEPSAPLQNKGRDKDDKRPARREAAPAASEEESQS
ncbi:MAG: 30S ribosomal protein S6 [Parvibaculales bacterium]